MNPPALCRAIVRPKEVSVAKKNKALFDPKKFLAKVGEGKAITKYQKNEIIFSQGDPADAVFYIQKGKLKLTVISEQGKEAVIAILGPGHFFGEGCLNGHGLRIATTAAMDDCVVTRITKAAMIATLHNEAHFGIVYFLSIGSQHSDRRGPGRSIVQFQRKAPCAAAAAPCEFRQGSETRAHRGKDQSGNVGGDDRNDESASQSLHEQIPQIGLHRL